MEKTRFNAYDEIMKRINEALASGTAPWHRPWVIRPECIVSHNKGRPYSLRNRMMLSYAGEYATFHQVKQEGGSVNKGAKSKMVFFAKYVDKKNENGEVIDSYHCLRAFLVFHIQDTTLEPKYKDKWGGQRPPEGVPMDIARSYSERAAVRWLDGGNRAFYSPTDDTIQVPSFTDFECIEEYWSTVFHELAHSTAKRLCRRIGDAFGSSNYAKEELVAEITAALCLGRLGIDTESTALNSAAYIDNWRKKINNMKAKDFNDACRFAESACGLIFGDKDTDNDDE